MQARLVPMLNLWILRAPKKWMDEILKAIRKATYKRDEYMLRIVHVKKNSFIFSLCTFIIIFKKRSSIPVEKNAMHKR